MLFEKRVLLPCSPLGPLGPRRASLGYRVFLRHTHRFDANKRSLSHAKHTSDTESPRFPLCRLPTAFRKSDDSRRKLFAYLLIFLSAPVPTKNSISFRYEPGEKFPSKILHSNKSKMIFIFSFLSSRSGGSASSEESASVIYFRSGAGANCERLTVPKDFSIYNNFHLNFLIQKHLRFGVA